MLKGGAQHVLRWLLLAALYAAAGALTLPIPPLDNPVVPLWLPSGIGIAAVLGFGPVLLPGLVLGELVLRTLFSSPFWFTAGNILAVLAEALLVLWVARRLFRPGLPDLRDNLPAEALLLAALLVSTAAAAALSLAFAPVGLSAGFLPTFVEQWFARASGAVLLVVPLLLLRRDTERVAASVQQQWRSLLIVAGVGIGYLFAAWRAEFSWLGDLYAVVLPWVAIGALMAFLLTPLLAGCVALLCFGCLIAGVWWFHYVPDSTADLTGLLVVQAYLVSTVLAVQFYGMLSAQRARQQRVLAELENRFQLLAEQSLQGIWVQRRGNLLYSNAAGARIFGYRTPEELLSLGSLWPLIHPDERDRIARYHEQRLKGEQAPTLLEFRALHRDGRELVIETVATTLDWEGAPAVQNVLIDVSERVEAQGELAERERQYRNLLANLPGAAYRFVLVDESWRIEFVSAGVKEMLGYEPDDLLSGRRDFVNDLLHPEDRDKLGAAVSEAVRGGSMYRLTYRLKHADGRYRHVLGHGCTVSDPDTRRVTAVEGIIIDITDRIEAERRLELSEARYRNFVEHSNEGVFRIDFDPPIPIGLPVDSQLEAAFARGVFSDSNDLAIRLIGFEPDQLKQTPLGLTAVMPHWRSAETRNALRQFILAGYSAVQMPLALRCTEERTLMTSISASGVVKDGALCQVWGVFVDVTDRFETQQRLRQSEHRFRSIFEESPLGIYLSDDAFTFRQVNPALCEMLGYDAQALLGRHVYDGLLVSEDRAQTEALAQSVRAGESNSYTAERRYLHRDGHTVWTRAHVARLNGDTERSGLVLALLEDITEVVVAEDRAARHRQEMMEADKMISLGTLVSGVAHEINNPNQNISLNAPFLEEVWKDLMPLLDEYITSGGRIDRGSGLPWEELRQEVPRAIAEIRDSTTRIARIVNELRDYSRGQSPRRGVRVNLNEVVTAACTLLASQIRAGQLVLSLALEEQLAEVTGDFHRLEQVVINLLMNACRASEPGGNIVVTTRMDPNGGTVTFEVRDEGHGIEKDHLERVLDPFFTTWREEGGTGLGLAVSSRIVREHGGEMAFDSKVGEGTRVRVILPSREE